MAATVVAIAGGVVALVLWMWGSWVSDTCERDAREGAWMRDASFTARWTAPACGGFSRMRFPGVVCVAVQPHLDGRGRPTSCAECVTVISDDCTRSLRDLLDGKLDGEPFAPGSSFVMLCRRVGDARPLAAHVARGLGADEILIVHGRTRTRIPVPEVPAATSAVAVHGAARPTSGVVTTRRGPDDNEAYERLRVIA